MLHSDHVDPLYRGWARSARQHVRDLDAELLQAMVPHRGVLPDFPQGSAGFATTIEQQLELLAGWEADLLRAELEAAWRGDELPAAAQRLLAAGPAGMRRLAGVFGDYWEAVLAPHWRRMWAVLESEIAYRARQLAREFGRAVATVSEHLSTLQRCGMIMSWRSGRSVLYQRTPLATSPMITADAGDGPA